MSFHYLSWEETIKHVQQNEAYRQLVHDAYYDIDLLKACTRYLDSEEFREILSYLPTSGSLLDVGAGRGISSFAFAHKGFDVTALEPNSSDVVGVGAIHSLNAFVESDILTCQAYSENIPLKAESFDVIFVRAALHHSQDIYQACSEYYRLLKPNGILFVAREHVLSKPKDLVKFLESHPLHSFYGGENAFVLQQYIKAFQNASLTIRKVLFPIESPINYSPYTKKQIINLSLSKLPKSIKNICSLPLYLISQFSFLWFFLSRVFEIFDNRPGRLFSFVLQK